jgi:arsenate reductase (thioredoxin)
LEDDLLLKPQQITRINTTIAVCDDADQNCPTAWPGVNTRMHWSFEDPAKFEGSEEEKLAKFREVRDLFEEGIRQWVVEQYIFADY